MGTTFGLKQFCRAISSRLAGSTPDLRCGNFDDLSVVPDSVREFVGRSYPRNHTYTLERNRLVPGRRLASRVADVSRFYPDGYQSFLDLSCSKGYFVFHASQSPECRRAVGIDIDETCLDACEQIAVRHRRRNTLSFVRSTLPDLAEQFDDLGGPFDVALLINTYQYLRLGSEAGPAQAGSHRELFAMMQKVCRGRLIFHNRLAFDDLQTNVKERTGGRDARDYNPDAILEAASEYFFIRHTTSDPLRPVLILDNRVADGGSRVHSSFGPESASAPCPGSTGLQPETPVPLAVPG